MRLTTVILIASLMQVNASTFGQRITINQDNASIKSVFREIRKQSGYSFFYDGKIITERQKVSVKITNVSVDEALNTVLNGLDLTYKIEGRIVSIKKKDQPSFFENLVAQFQSIDVRGRIMDKDGNGIIGATVSVKGMNKSISTGTNGFFTLRNVEDNAIIVISYIGYMTKELNAVENLGDVILDLSSNPLDEVQILAYGQTSKRLSTGNIATIKADDIAKSPVSNPLLAISGRVPGLFIEQGSGMPNSSIKVRIQGTNSFRSNGNEPFFVVDGVPYVSSLLLGIDNGLSNQGNPLNYINPNDIESIDILKDADATAIYGSRAANGAILITTKKGKSGSTKVDLSLQSGFAKETRRIDLLNTTQYLEMRHEAAKNDNLNINAAPNNSPSGIFRDLLTWDQNNYTDWQEELLGGTARFHNHTISFSGGSEKTTYLAGATYRKETTIFPGDFDNKSIAIHFNINNSSVNNKFKFQLTGNYLNGINTLPGIDLTNAAITLPPNAPNIYNSDGSLNWATASNGTSTWYNPIASLNQKFQSKSSNLIANSVLSYAILSNLELRSSFGFTNLQIDEFKTNPASVNLPEDRNFINRRTNFGNSISNSWIIEPQLNYKITQQKHNFDLLLGGTFQQNKGNAKQISADGFSDDVLMEDIKSATNILVNNVLDFTYRYSAVFGRINYNYDNRYIINFTGRRDASSRFGENNRLHTFAGLSGAWLFSNENFMKNLAPFFSFGKIRVSYGTTGNDQITDYNYLSLYSATSAERPYQNTKGISPYSLSNPYIQWEETKKSSIGLDLGFLRDKIIFNINYNKNRSSNQLLGYDLPIITGFQSINSNFPASIENSGWEFNLNSRNINLKDFSWQTNVNLTIPKNRLIDFDNLKNTSYASLYEVGQSINIVKKFKYDGVNSQTGLYEFEDKNGRLTSYPNSAIDNIVSISPDPKFYGGVQNSIAYKNISLDFLFSYVKQLGETYLNGTIPGQVVTNQPLSVLNRWQNPGDNSEVQRYTTNRITNYRTPTTSFRGSDARFGDASFIRLRNISLSYKLPNKVVKYAKLGAGRIIIQGQNIFTITNYIGLDPENRSSASLPPLRTITFGLQVSL